MPNDERPAVLRIHTLEDAVLELTVNVRSLVDALQVVGALSAAQHAQADRQLSFEKHAGEAEALALARYHRITGVQRFTAVTVTAIVATISLLAYWSLTVQVNQQFTKEQNDLTTSCQLRNQTNVVIPQQRELALAAAYAVSDPNIAKIHRDSATALAKSAVNCSIYKRETK